MKRTVHTARTSPAAIAYAERVSLALKHRRRGFTFQQIGKALETSTAAAFRLVSKGLHQIGREEAEALYTLEMARLDELLSTVYPAARNGNIASINTCLSIMAALNRLAGIDRTPGRTVAPPEMEISFTEVESKTLRVCPET